MLLFNRRKLDGAELQVQEASWTKTLAGGVQDVEKVGKASLS